MKILNRILLDPTSTGGNPGQTPGSTPSTNPPASPPTNPPAPVIVPQGYIAVTESNAMIEKVRKEEKDKLYPKITELETQSTTLKEQIKLLEAKNVELSGKLAAIGTARTATGEVDVTKLTEEIATRAAAGVRQATEETIRTLQTRLEKTERENQSLALDNLRKKLIEENGGPNKLIVELVRGNSEQELKDSVTSAKQAFERVQATIGTPSNPPSIVNGQQDNAGGSQPNPGVPPSLPGSSVAQGGQPPNSGATNGSVRTMGLKTFAERREALKQSTVGRYVGVR